jgi:hypothetical protein
MDASAFHVDSKIISYKTFPTFLLFTTDDYFPISFVTVSLTHSFEIAKETADFVTYHWAVQMGRKDLEFVALNFTFSGFHFFIAVCLAYNNNNNNNNNYRVTQKNGNF